MQINFGGLISAVDRITNSLGRIASSFAMVTGETAPKFWVTRITSNQSVATASHTKLQFNSKKYDSAGNFDLTNYYFVAPKAGFYHFDAGAHFTTLADGKRSIISIFVNGSEACRGNDKVQGASSDPTVTVSCTLFLNASDQVDVRVWHDKGSNCDIQLGDYLTYFSGFFLVDQVAAQMVFDLSGVESRLDTVNSHLIYHRGMGIASYDDVARSWNAGTYTETWTFKTGGSGGTTVATVTIVYDDASRSNVVHITRV
jgi:hypothetical protein